MSQPVQAPDRNPQGPPPQHPPQSGGTTSFLVFFRLRRGSALTGPLQAVSCLWASRHCSFVFTWKRLLFLTMREMHPRGLFCYPHRCGHFVGIVLFSSVVAIAMQPCMIRWHAGDRKLLLLCRSKTETARGTKCSSGWYSTTFADAFTASGAATTALAHTCNSTGYNL